MILGTSKILTFFGPIIGHFWARRPCIYGSYYPKLLHKILESMLGHLGEYNIFAYMRIKMFEKIHDF